MSRIKYKNYNILKFSELQISQYQLCVGIIGYLFLYRKGKNNVSFIPSAFIIALENKCKQKIIDWLITNNYIILVTPTHKNKQYYIATGLTKPEKKDPNLYIVTVKLTNLYEQILFDDDLTQWIDEHLHLLNRQYFNHYNNAYKHIKINLPYTIRQNYEIEELNIIDEYGDPSVKDYDINRFGFDNNKYAGEHLSLFTKHKELIHYTSVKDPWEVGIFDSIPLILADQLYKTIGKNDFSSFYRKGKFKKGLFKTLSDYYLFQEIFEQTFYTAIFGYEHIKEFKDKWPDAHNKLYQIKSGRSDIQPYFLGFTTNIKPNILKSDFRLTIKSSKEVMQRGQTYYKIVPLVIRIRIVKIMRDIWKRLKKCEVPFIPLFDSVIVFQDDNKKVQYIFDDVLKHHIDYYLKYIVSSVPIKFKHLLV